MEQLAAGSTVQNLKSDTVKTVVIPVLEDIDAQKELAETMALVDSKLENERTYLAKLEKTKNGLIQDLLQKNLDVSVLKI